MEILKHLTNQNYLFELINFLKFFVNENLIFHLHFDYFLKILEFIFSKLIHLEFNDVNHLIVINLSELLILLATRIKGRINKIDSNDKHLYLLFLTKVTAILIDNFINFKSQFIQTSDPMLQIKIKMVGNSLKIVVEYFQFRLYFYKTRVPLNFKRFSYDLMMIAEHVNHFQSDYFKEVLVEIINQNMQLFEEEHQEIMDIKILTELLVLHSTANFSYFIQKLQSEKFDRILFIEEENKYLKDPGSQKYQNNLKELLKHRQVKHQKLDKQQKLDHCIKRCFVEKSEHLNGHFLYKLLVSDISVCQNTITANIETLLNLNQKQSKELIDNLNERFTLLSNSQGVKFEKINIRLLFTIVNTFLAKGNLFVTSFDFYCFLFKLIINTDPRATASKIPKNHSIDKLLDFPEPSQIKQKSKSVIPKNKIGKEHEECLLNNRLMNLINLDNLSNHLLTEFTKKPNLKNLGLCFFKLIDLLNHREIKTLIKFQADQKLIDFVFSFIGQNQTLDLFLLKSLLIRPSLFLEYFPTKQAHQIANILFRNESEENRLEFKNLKVSDIKLESEMQNIIFESKCFFLEAIIETKNEVLSMKIISEFVIEFAESLNDFLSHKCDVIFSKQVSDQKMIFEKLDSLEVNFSNYKTASEFHLKNGCGNLIRANQFKGHHHPNIQATN